MYYKHDRERRALRQRLDIFPEMIPKTSVQYTKILAKILVKIGVKYTKILAGCLSIHLLIVM